MEGAVVSKPMAKNITCFCGILLRELQRVGRRIDDAHVHAARFVFQRAAVRAGNAHHVAKGGENNIGLRCERQTIVDAAHGKNANRAARPVNQFDVGREQILQAETINGVGVAAAHFHEAIVAIGIGERANFFARLWRSVLGREIHPQISLLRPLRRVVLEFRFETVAANFLHRCLRSRPAS